MFILIVWFVTSSWAQLPLTERVDTREQCEALGQHLVSAATAVKSYECYELKK